MSNRRKYAVISKAIGETPLHAIESFRIRENISRDIPLAYAGRLDPMASGELLVLIGDECKKQAQYHHLDKQYEFEILFGITSDTSDVLGVAYEKKDTHEITKQSLDKISHDLIGEITLPYPHFSSKTVAGKPLFLWQLEGRIDEIEIPTKTSILYTLTCEQVETISKDTLKKNILEKINSFDPITDESKKLGADFRRADIRARWEELFATTSCEEFFIARFSCICSSGTYMRTLAHTIAERADTTGLAYSIHRTHIGKYWKIGPIGFWLKKYR